MSVLADADPSAESDRSTERVAALAAAALLAVALLGALAAGRLRSPKMEPPF